MNMLNTANNDAGNADLQDGNTQTSTESQEQTNRASSDDQNKNWRALRQSKEEAERRADESRRQNDEYKKIIEEMKSQDTEIEDDDSDIPTLGQTKKAARQEATKIAKEMIDKTLKERRQQNAPKELKRDFTDFDDVVTKENIDYLIETDPEAAEILRETPDLYKQGKRAYSFIKKAGIHKKDSVESMKQDAEANSNKPLSPNASATKNSVGDANMFSGGLTDDLKKQLNKEMINAIKRR